MTSSETLLPPPNVVSAAVVELAAADQPRSADEGLDLLNSVGISGTLGPTTAQSSTVVADPTGSWRATTSSLTLGPDAAVSGFVSSMWYDGAPEDVTLGVHTLIGTVSGAVGAPDHDERRSDGSRATWWIRDRFDIEVYFFAQTPRSRAGAQIAVHWKAVDSGHGPAVVPLL
jgi:hypothetical protein